MKSMHPSWLKLLEGEFEKPSMKGLEAFLGTEKGVIYPPREDLFSAFRLAAFEDVKVVVVGQDPYHGPGQAHGLSFSVPKGVPLPPSLQNIFKELGSDLGVVMPKHGCLVEWAKQGVLLLNATLTVRAGEPKSHYGRGWEVFTDRVVQLLCEREAPLVFMLWGRSAMEKVKNVDGKRHLVLTSVHPSPLSAYGGFFGCKHFSKANEFLKQVGKAPISWALS